MEIGLSLGSNLGDRVACFATAMREIAKIPDVRIVARSPIYETEPVDVEEGHKRFQFLNSMVVIDYPDGAASSVLALLRKLQHIERTIGQRLSGVRNAPRRMDIDVIYAGDLVVDLPDLALPHPRWAGRRFVVQPLADVRPALCLPGETRTVKQVLDSLPEIPAARLFDGTAG
ncbi:MAG: 2-amino-4-hydroxy-6-hydroxymethyldihydropteridine diphosphokinase [Kiritimatiellae bacterium]|nr:2-amino-4-hydroxy-6-hydroxymethyldihydropteridine diphosphokinase [Kiritimatiellia bacterium]